MVRDLMERAAEGEEQLERVTKYPKITSGKNIPKGDGHRGGGGGGCASREAFIHDKWHILLDVTSTILLLEKAPHMPRVLIHLWGFLALLVSIPTTTAAAGVAVGILGGFYSRTYMNLECPAGLEIHRGILTDSSIGRVTAGRARTIQIPCSFHV